MSVESLRDSRTSSQHGAMAAMANCSSITPNSISAARQEMTEELDVREIFGSVATQPLQIALHVSAGTVHALDELHLRSACRQKETHLHLVSKKRDAINPQLAAEVASCFGF